MKVFIDTSSLLKKYVLEKGTEEFNAVLNNVTEIIVAPVTILEVHSAIERRLRDKTLKPSDAKWIEKEFLIDYNFFGVVRWNDDLMGESIRVIRKYQLKVLDGIQLASALRSDTTLFVTSDKRLSEAAENELRKVELV